MKSEKSEKMTGGSGKFIFCKSKELFSGLKTHLQYKTSQFYSQTKASSGRPQKSACNSRIRASRNLGQVT